MGGDKHEDLNVISNLSPKSRLKSLLSGAYSPGDANNSWENLPDWFTREKFDKGRKLIDGNSCSNYFSTNIGVVLVSQVSSLMDPLIETGNVCTVFKSQTRVARTFQYVLSWNVGNVFDPKDDAHKNLRLVRNMHKKVAELMNKKYPVSQIWVSQLDMALTQFSIVGPMMLFPEKIGVYLSDEDLELVAFFWRTIGYLLGVQDEFNLCTGTYQEIRQRCWDIVEVIIKPTLFNPKTIYTECLFNGITGLKKFAHFIDYSAFVNWTYELIGLEERLPINIYGQLCMKCWKGTVNILYYDSIRKRLSHFYRKTVNRRINRHISNLEVKHSLGYENLVMHVYNYVKSAFGIFKKIVVPNSLEGT